MSDYFTTHKIGRSLLLALPMIILNFMLITRGNLNFSGSTDVIAFSITFLFFSYLFFMMLYSGKTDKYRATGFIVFAMFFAFTFIVNLIKIRGTNTFDNETILACEIPMCHIPAFMFIIPAVFTKTIIFPGNIGSITFMLIATVGMSIVLGRGICSWGCLFGGWDECASRITRKPVIKKVNAVFRWTSFAVLLIVVLWSAATLSPTYCWWLCPFKAVTEYEEVSSFSILLKTIVFSLLFAGLVIVLPILTKKRIQCATFCPMGAFLSLTNKINIFEIRIDKEKCNNCGTCSKICPTLSLSKTNIEETRPSITCTKCGKCIDVCSRHAIQYHIKGTSVIRNISLSRYLFLYPAFILLVIFAGAVIQHGIVLIINLITTGSML
ncbi:MAG: 4Fe-4S binding protein [Bacteroidales bacterium]|nr:4Fe-4S binding protein [Bacteroidales bacterium]